MGSLRHVGRPLDRSVSRAGQKKLRPDQRTAVRSMSSVGDAVLDLQRDAGNAAVTSLLSHRGGATRGQVGPPELTIDAVVTRRETPKTDTPRPAESSSRVPGRELDAEEDDGGHEVDPGAVTAHFTDQLAGVVGSSGAGQSGVLRAPDLVMPEELAGEDKDAVASAVTFEPTVAQSGAVSPFGATTWANFNILGLVVRSGAGKFTVSFRLQNPITYNVDSPKPSIASETDPAITAANYAAVATSLTPNMAFQNGKPPRTQYWARDLTSRHERFHSDERRRLNRAGATQAQAWLNGQSAATVGDVAALVAQVPAKVIAASQAAVGTLDEKESRAYGDGAPSYKARAEAIKTKGAAGTYK